MPTNSYGTPISDKIPQTTAHAQVVIDTAITVWMQMGLSEDQILYGIAMMNVESGYSPVITNHQTDSSIRGLGQFSTDTWNATAKSFGAAYGFRPSAPVPYIANQNFNPQQTQGTNAPAGESNDFAAGVYDPQGLVTQLEVVGQGIKREWNAANSPNEQAALQKIAALGVPDAAVLVSHSSTDATLLSTVALAYLNHHEGLGWWNEKLAKNGLTNFNNTLQHLKAPSLQAAIQNVVQGVQNELDYVRTKIANPTGTAADLLRGDPWKLSGAYGSISDGLGGGPAFISHDIPGLIGSIDNFFSQTEGGLTSYVVNSTTHVSEDKTKHTDDVSYTYSAADTAALDVVSGSDEYNFQTHTGHGTETFGNGDVLSYTESNGLLQSTEYDSTGKLIETMTDSGTVLIGTEILSQVYTDGSKVTSGNLAYFNLVTGIETEGTYDGQGRLTAVSYGSSTIPTIVTFLSTQDPDYAQKAAALAQQYGVPVTDSFIQNANNPLQQVDTTTIVDQQGDATTYSNDGITAATASADPGFQADVLQGNGNTLRWSFNVDGTIASRDSVDQAGNSTSENFDAAGNYLGTSTSTTNPDGSILTRTYDTTGNSTGARTVTAYGSGTITINGITTSYPNGFTVTNQYGPQGTSGPMSGFTVSSTLQNSDGTYTTTEVNYQVLSGPNGALTDQLLGSTITNVNGYEATSTDYDANGHVLGSREMVTNNAGVSTIERFDSAGTLLGSSTLSISNQGDVVLQSLDSNGTLTENRDLSESGALTDTQYQNGNLTGVTISKATADNGNLTTYQDASGNITGDKWVLSDGSYGSDTVQAGGTIAGTSHFTDSTSSSSVNDGSGRITTTNYNAAGTVTGTTTTVVQDGSTSAQFLSASAAVSTSASVHADGAMQATSAQAGGATVGVSLDAADNLSWIQSTGAGATTADVLDSDGDVTGTTVTSVAADGSVTVTQFDTTGAETGYSQTVASGGVTTTTQYAGSGGTFTQTGYTQAVVNADGGVTTTDYAVADGVSTETGYSTTVTNANGSTTTTVYALDSSGAFVKDSTEVVSTDEQGHVTKAEYDGSGAQTGYTLERTDTSGDVLITQYDSTGSEIRSTEVASSGVVTDVEFNTLNGIVTTTWQADGSYQQKTDDGEGDVTTTSYAANGNAESDTWTQGDGSSGNDSLNADGSVTAVSNDGQGNLTTTTAYASGEISSVTNYYDHGPLTAVTDTNSPSWGLRNSVHVDSSADGLTTTTSKYDASGTLLSSQTVVTSNGGLTLTTSNFDGSGNRLNYNTVATSTDGLTVTTTNYGGSGNILGSIVDATSADGKTVTESTYSTGSLLGKTTHVTSADGFTTTISDYDGAGNLLDYQTQVTSSDGLTLTTSDYNGSGTLQDSTVAVTSSDGLTVTTSRYDGSQTLLGSTVEGTSIDGQTTRTTDYDANGAKTDSKVTQSSYNSTATTTYDAAGNLTGEQVALTGGVEPGELTVGIAAVNGAPSLVLTGPTDTITVAGGLADSVAGATSFTFDVGATMSLVQLVQHAAAVGNAHATTLTGAFGNLIFDPDSGASLLGGSGLDTISVWGDNDTVTASSGGSIISAEGAYDVLNGGAGNETLGAFGAHTTVNGGSGDDLFQISDPTDVIVAGTGIDSVLSSVSYTLPDGIDVLTLTGTADLTAVGNDDDNNVITGNSGHDRLQAGDGDNDTLISGTGIDTLVGGAGLDVFVINNAADQIFLPWWGGNDTIQSSVSYTLYQSIGTLELTGSANLTATDFYGYATLVANSGNDTLYGGWGNDTLVSGTGIDTLVTGTGFNTLVINNAADVVVVSPGAAFITIQSSVSYTLQSGGALDRLLLIGSANLVGTGNDDATNYVSGNAGSDTLIAGSGSDTLVAGTGIDTLIAGSGTDLLQGGAGDTFVLSSGHAEIQVSQGSGILQFGTGVSASQLTLSLTSTMNGDSALLITDGSSSVTVDGGLQGSISEFDFADGSSLTLSELLAAGQVLNSTLSGWNGDTILDGSSDVSYTTPDGNDTLFAAGSNDTIIAGNGNQAIYGLGANEVLAGSTGDDSLYGGSGADTLIGGIGSTLMQGGSGDDAFVLTQGGTATLIPGSSPGAEWVYVPQGMTIADFSGYQSGNDLVLQSSSGDTTAVISGFYGPESAHKTWLIADGTSVQFLANWVGSQHQTPPPHSSYEAGIDAARQAYLAKLGVSLQSIGKQGGSLTNPAHTPPADNYSYTFGGVSHQSQSVSNNGTLNVGSSANDQKTFTTSETEQTQTWDTPVYSTETFGGYQYFVPVNNTYSNVDLGGDGGPPSPIGIYGNMTIVEQFDGAGNPTGSLVTVAPQTMTVQTGVVHHSVTVPVETTYTTEAQSFNIYNITTDDTNDTVLAQPNFVGSVVTGDGDETVDLGGAAQNNSDNIGGHLLVRGLQPGAFIQAGNGNDTISGTGGEDGIAAGTGFDYLQGWQGTTYYVPMSGDSTDIIDANSAFYAYGPFAMNTLVLPDGVTPQNLQLKLFTDPNIANADIPPGSVFDDFNPATLQLKYGDSTVLVPIDIDPYYVPGQQFGQPVAPTGIQQFQFADGTVIGINQMLTMAQEVDSADDYNPVVNVNSPTITNDQPLLSASDLFSASDASGSNITWYAISTDSDAAGYFTLNGAIQAAGSTFLVDQQHLSGLEFVVGAAGTDDNIHVQAWDGIKWGDWYTGDVYNQGPDPQAAFANLQQDPLQTGTQAELTLVNQNDPPLTAGSPHMAHM